ncbi:MAG TPA: MOSC domain-containing protein [Aggregatilineales bacterium]|nr:MOSC domain-containing protein [Aggregatilineales bacterium]
MNNWTLKSIQTAMPQERSDGERTWLTGIFKTPIEMSVYASRNGLAGDGVGDTENHGGVDKAVCCHAWQHHLHWNTYFSWELQPGAFGENFTITGLSEIDVCVGDIWQIGSAGFQVSQPRVPCWKQSHKLMQPGFEKLVMETGRSGFYLRVLADGTVTPGDQIILRERPHSEASLVRLNRALRESKNMELAEEFAGLEPLAEAWRSMFMERLDHHLSV